MTRTCVGKEVHARISWSTGKNARFFAWHQHNENVTCPVGAKITDHSFVNKRQLKTQ